MATLVSTLVRKDTELQWLVGIYPIRNNRERRRPQQGGARLLQGAHAEVTRALSRREANGELSAA
jgi:hypothetical protein